MSKIRNVVLKAAIFSIAILPFSIIYGLSDLLAFLIRDVFQYRKETVKKNLHNCFPEKSPEEIRAITKDFYRNLADLVLEIIKSSRMSRKQLEKRVVFKNREVFDELFEDGKNVFAALGHCGNWEWTGNKLATFVKHEGAAIYKPAQDPFVDDYMISLRQKYKGTLMIDYRKVFRTLVSLKEKLVTVFILADQSPPRTEMNYFVNFFGRKTAFFEGMEKVARTLNYAVIYLDIRRLSRGHYEVEAKLITSEAKTTETGFINRKYVQLLEETIRQQPDNWLWSHRRWKQKQENRK